MAAPWLWVQPLGSHLVNDITLGTHQTAQVQERRGRGFAPGCRHRGPLPSAELGLARRSQPHGHPPRPALSVSFLALHRSRCCVHAPADLCIQSSRF